MTDEPLTITTEGKPGDDLTKAALLGETDPPFFMALFLGETRIACSEVAPYVRWKGHTSATMIISMDVERGVDFDRVCVHRAGDELWCYEPTVVHTQPGDCITVERPVIFNDAQNNEMV